jgi:pyruvate/2-oxoglutarate dehydrogenase complex dihydrolipoamide acyltransferase (E2) component
MSAETSVPSQSRDFHYWRLRFRAWRGVRPFWAGLFTIIGGVPIMYFPYNDLKMGALTLTMATTAGAGSLIIGVLLVTLGLTMWFHSIVRIFAGVAAILLALVSIPVSNIGGFLVGFLLALLGGAMSIAWAPAKPSAEPPTQPDGAAFASAPASAPEPAPAPAEQTMALGQVPQQAGEPKANLSKSEGPGTGPDTNTTDSAVDADDRRNSAG